MQEFFKEIEQNLNNGYKSDNLKILESIDYNAEPEELIKEIGQKINKIISCPK